MTFRGDAAAVQARIEALEDTLEERERELAELDRQVAEREAALAAELPKERHFVRVRQLEAAITETEREAGRARDEATRRPSTPLDPAASRLIRLGTLVVLYLGLLVVLWLVVTR